MCGEGYVITDRAYLILNVLLLGLAPAGATNVTALLRQIKLL
jgi:hypothetical protein